MNTSAKVDWSSQLLNERQRVVRMQLMDGGGLPYKNADIERRVVSIKREADIYRQLSWEDLMKVQNGELPNPELSCYGFQESKEGMKRVWFEKIHERFCPPNSFFRLVESTVCGTKVLREIDWDLPFQYLEQMQESIVLVSQYYQVEQRKMDTVIKAPHESITLVNSYPSFFVLCKIAERMMQKMTSSVPALPVEWPAPVFPSWSVGLPRRECRDKVQGVYVTKTGVVDFNERADLLGALLPTASGVFVWASKHVALLTELYPDCQVGGLIRNDPLGVHLMTMQENGSFFLAIVDLKTVPEVKVEEQIQQWGFGPLRYQALTFRSRYHQVALNMLDVTKMVQHYELSSRPVVVVQDVKMIRAGDIGEPDEDSKVFNQTVAMTLDGKKQEIIPRGSLVLAATCPSEFNHQKESGSLPAQVVSVQQYMLPGFRTIEEHVKRVKTWMSPGVIPVITDMRPQGVGGDKFQELPSRVKLVSQIFTPPVEKRPPLQNLDEAHKAVTDLVDLSDSCHLLHLFLQASENGILQLSRQQLQDKEDYLSLMLLNSCYSVYKNALAMPMNNSLYSRKLLGVMKLDRSVMSSDFQAVHSAMCVPYTECWFGTIAQVLFRDARDKQPRRVLLSPTRWYNMYAWPAGVGMVDVLSFAMKPTQWFQQLSKTNGIPISYIDSLFDGIMVSTSGQSSSNGTGTWTVFGKETPEIMVLLQAIGLVVHYGEDYCLRADSSTDVRVDDMPVLMTEEEMKADSQAAPHDHVADIEIDSDEDETPEETLARQEEEAREGRWW